LVIAGLCALVNAGSPQDIEQLKNDYIIKAGNSKNRLAGWQVLAPKDLKCDMVRRNIKKFGFCFNDENAAQGINSKEYQGWVREVVQQWAKCGGIQIVEEPKCRRGPDFVTVNVGSYGAVLQHDMDPATCKINGFDIYMSFFTFGENSQYYNKTEKLRKSEIQMYALHEFGHFLGFDHEHNRNDRTGKCDFPIDAPETGPNKIWDNYQITKEYDLESIMNYCRPNVHFKPWLSEKDKQGIRAIYGGGNQQECDAVTKPWKWGPGEGVEDYLEGLYAEGLTVNFTPATQPGPEPEPEPAPQGCADVATKDICDNRLESCKDESMKYWCPKSCNYCQ